MVYFCSEFIIRIADLRGVQFVSVLRFKSEYNFYGLAFSNFVALVVSSILTYSLYLKYLGSDKWNRKFKVQTEY